MLKFDRAKFYAGFREFEDELTQQQVNGVNFILDSMEKDPFLKKIEHAAYMFATVKPETAHTYQPIHEYGGYKYFVKRYGSQTKVGRGLGNDTPEEGAIYAGRGDVQLTGEDNYEKAEAALRKYYPEIVKEFEQRTGKKFDLTVGDQPNDAGDADNASDPAIAYAIMSFGMHTGMFTGRSLKSHTTAAGFDAYNARDIINADKKKNGKTIEGYYNHFLAILKASLIRSATTAKAGPSAAQDELSSNSVDTSDPSSELPPTIPAPPPQAEGQTIVDVPPVVTEKEEGIVSKIKTWYAALPAFLLSILGGFWSWLQGAATEIIVAFLVTAGVVAIVYLILNSRARQIEKQLQFEAEQKQKDRDFELTKLQLQSAMDPNKQTVRVSPPVVVVPNAEEV